METDHMAYVLFLILSFLLLAAVHSQDTQDAALDDAVVSQPQKRSVAVLPAENQPFPTLYAADFDSLDKRSSLFRFGKRGGLFWFGKWGSLFRFGKRSSLFRFGKRGSLFRFGKRDDSDQDDDWHLYPASNELPVDDLKREVRSFHWGRETEE